MEGADYLLTCAEVAVALEGFSALVVALGGRPDSGVDPLSRGLVGTLIERSLIAMFFSLAPVLLSGLGLAPARIWLACSGILAAYILSLAWRSATLRRRDATFADLLEGPLFATLMALGVVVLLLQIAHAFALGIEQSVWWYLVGVTWLLLAASYLFYFAIRRWARDA
jgi:hypothetical protein